MGVCLRGYALANYFLQMKKPSSAGRLGALSRRATKSAPSGVRHAHYSGYEGTLSHYEGTLSRYEGAPGRPAIEGSSAQTAARDATSSSETRCGGK
jgi:hypothetical protein